MPSPFTFVNKNPYSHADLKFKLFGIPIRAVSEVAWKPTIEKGEVKGAAREVIAHTSGTVKYEASLTMNKAEWEATKVQARAIYGRAPLDIEADLTVQLASRGMPTRTAQIHLDGITEDDSSSSAGNEALNSKLTFSVLYIKEDGQALIDNSIF